MFKYRFYIQSRSARSPLFGTVNKKKIMLFNIIIINKVPLSDLSIHRADDIEFTCFLFTAYLKG